MPLTKHNLIEAAKLVKNERAKDFLMLLSVPEHAKFLNDFFNGKADAEVAAYNQTTRNKIPRFSKSRYKETATHRALCKIRDHIEKIQKLEGKPQQKALIEFVNYLNKVPIQNVHNLYNLNGYTVSIITKAAREKILQGSTYSTLEECLKVKPEIQRPSILLKDQNTRQHSPMMKKLILSRNG
ncbi:MAG: hypothetical protein HWD59_14920 [Coxiellaceae bacterium]|nr:MAG: hypothetical protein HWD59_14920 [Coxiellaceae bacterium]